jgi:hypothetical protein
LKGFTFIHNEKEICEFLPLYSELQQKENSDLDSFTIGMAYSNMNLINTSLIAAYDIGGTEEYERILKIYAPYVDAMARTELIFMDVLPDTTNESSNEINIKTHEDLVNFLSNPNWTPVFESIKNSIKTISEKVIDEHPLKRGLMLRDLSKTASSMMIPGLHWYEKPIASLLVAKLILEKFDFPPGITLGDFHEILSLGIPEVVKTKFQTEGSPIISDIAHDMVMTVLRCVKLAQNDQIDYYFSAIRYSSTAPIIKDQTKQYCPFYLLCNDPILRNEIRQSESDNCTLRESLMQSLKTIESSVPDDECCSVSSDFINIQNISEKIPQHIENLLNCLLKISTENSDCQLCQSLKSTMSEQGYTKEIILALIKNTNSHLTKNLDNVLKSN